MKELVRRTIAEYGLFSPGDRVVVGVSGGPDSLALLHLLRALSDELQITLVVAHLNHRLRGAASEAEAEFVADVARDWGLPARVQSHDVAALAREQGRSIEEAGRSARYAFFAAVAAEAGAGVVAVGHNADDQAETILMHLLRGAGLAGLRGMAPNVQGLRFMAQPGRSQADTSNLKLVRPVLEVTRAEIEAYCKENGLSPRADMSNDDSTFFRNRLRHEVIPYLEGLNPNLRTVFRRMAESITDDYALLQTYVRAAFAQVAQVEEGAVVFEREKWTALHPALQRGTLRAAVERLRTNLRDIDWTHVEAARRVAREKETGAMAILPDGLVLVVSYDTFTIGDQGHATVPDMPLLNVDSLVLAIPGRTPLPGSDWVVVAQVVSETPGAANRWTAWLDYERVGHHIILRRRRPGDRFEPSGLGNSKSLHEFMIDAKIPRMARDRVPLLASDEQVVWVCGWRVDERAKVTPETRQMLRVAFEKTEQA